ncbi:YihA family ribosome biogenesis GTP-binding protein [bacterium]|nr:YihA family ribosome biogenesis GTP-binding protein [bacterium]
MRIDAVEFIGSFYKIDQIPQDDLPELPVFGRSNVGKSSVINCLTSRKIALVSKTPGKTQSLNYYKINERFYLVDVPGFGYAKVKQNLRESWKRVIEEWLTHSRKIQAVIQIVDSRHEAQTADLQLAEWLHHHRLSFIVIANKIDQIKKHELTAAIRKFEKTFGTDVYPFSAKTESGKKDLLQWLYSIVYTNHQYSSN